MDNDESNSQPIDEEEQLDQSASEATEEVVEEQEEVEEVEQTEEAVEEEVAEEDPAPPSRRENLRIQQLVKKLRQQTPVEQPQQPEAPAGLDYSNELSADDETIKTLQEDRQAYGNTEYTRGANEANKIAESNIFHTRLEIDAPKVADKYEFLDKESEKFHPAVANAVNEWYLATAGYDSQTRAVENSDIRYSEFVDGIFELADEIASNKVQSSRKNIAKQAATTGIRPDGSKAKRLNLNQAPGDMTDEELDAIISSGMPKK